MASSLPQTNDQLEDEPSGKTSSASNFSDFKAKLEGLIGVYLNVMDSIAGQPLIRMGKPLPKNFDRSPEDRIAQTRRSPLWASAFLLLLRSIRQGELPLAAIVLRYLENLFVSYHIKTRISRIADYLQFEELKMGLSAPPDKAITADFKILAKNLSKLENMLSSGVKLKIFLVISPVIPVVTWALDFFSVKANLPSLSSLNKADHRQKLMVWVGVTLIYVLFIVSASFIAKRKIMRVNKVYDLERELFDIMKRRPSHELPWDIIGWTILMGLYGFMYVEKLWGSAAGTFLSSQSKLIIFLVVAFVTVYVGGFIYALIRRLKLKQW